MKQSVIDSVLDDLNKEFGTTRKPLAATTGLIHDYLGITIDYSEKGTVRSNSLCTTTWKTSWKRCPKI
jgi:hypothetical protein